MLCMCFSFPPLALPQCFPPLFFGSPLPWLLSKNSYPCAGNPFCVFVYFSPRFFTDRSTFASVSARFMGICSFFFHSILAASMRPAALTPHLQPTSTIRTSTRIGVKRELSPLFFPLPPTLPPRKQRGVPLLLLHNIKDHKVFPLFPTTPPPIFRESGVGTPTSKSVRCVSYFLGLPLSFSPPPLSQFAKNHF